LDSSIRGQSGRPRPYRNANGARSHRLRAGSEAATQRPERPRTPALCSPRCAGRRPCRPSRRVHRHTIPASLTAGPLTRPERFELPTFGSRRCRFVGLFPDFTGDPVHSDHLRWGHFCAVGDTVWASLLCDGQRLHLARASAAAPTRPDAGERFVAQAVASRPAGRGRMRSSAEARLPRMRDPTACQRPDQPRITSLG